MPWSISDVERFSKGLTPSQKKRWVSTANSVLSDCKNKGGTDCEGRAVRIANSQAAKRGNESMDSKKKTDLKVKDEHYVAKLSDRESLDFRDIVESFDDPMADVEEANIDVKNRTIDNFCVFGRRESENGYTYMDKAVDTLTEMTNDAKVFINHPSKSEMKDRENVRDLRDWAGTLSNAKRDGDKVIAKFKVRKAYWPLVEDIAKMKPAKVGGSINSRVRVYVDEKGKESIVDIDRLNSVDLVASAATTVNLFESVKDNLEMEEQEFNERVTKIMEEKFPSWIEKVKEDFIREQLKDEFGPDVEATEPEVDLGPDVELEEEKTKEDT